MNRFSIILLLSLALCSSSAQSRWWKGNLHTHTLWSDGDDFPEMVAEWYKTNGYHFLAISDHNILLEGEKWIEVRTNASFQLALQKFQARHPKRVQIREQNGRPHIRLSNLEDFRGFLEAPGRFLLIPSEEISASFERLPIHINATNLREYIEPRSGSSVYEVMQKNIDAVLEQRERTGQPMIPHLNHPNFHYAVTAEDLMRVRGERFFEVYNGHPQVNNEGNATHRSTDQIWDFVLAWRLGVLNMEPMFGIAVDDTHNYHEFSPSRSNAGRGWILVRAKKLSPASIIQAMEQGDFYASSGVTLRDVRRSSNKLSVRIQPEKNTSYTIQFIGTSKTAVVTHPDGQKHVQPDAIGKILQETTGTSASYQLKGDELYVRARIISSRLKPNGIRPEEKEQAWTQPLIPKWLNK